MKVFISTVPFGEVSDLPLKLLRENNIEFTINPFGRKIKPKELPKFIKDCDCWIAGTEQITPQLLDKAKNLKLIVRAGAGLDNIPFKETKKRNIKVSYTPDAPTQAVAELCVGLIIDCLRRFSKTDKEIRKKKWNKYMGDLLQNKTVGIIGVGRIGKTLIKLLQPFDVKILGNDIVKDKKFAKKFNFNYVSKNEIFTKSDIISLNLSYSPKVKHLINKKVFDKMKNSAVLINTARGKIINETDLYNALKNKKISCAALDVYHEEPYSGKLKELDNIILAPHIGAATKESRKAMEVEAVKEVIRFYKNNK